MIKKINGDLCHDILSRNAPRRLGFCAERPFAEWKKEVREKLWQLLCMDRIAENSCPLQIEVEEEIQKDGYLQIRFTYESEIGSVVPCYLLISTKEKKTYPVAVLLQGHTTGFHNSIGKVKEDYEAEKYADDHYALQAVEAGFAALCIEQRGMGERGSYRRYGKECHYRPGTQSCAVTALTAINLGRTIIGERVWDVMRGIDALSEFAHYGLDLEKIMIAGHSGGGTATFYAACLEERIGYAVPNGAFCSFETSVMDVEHCVCNYIPDICTWFEMEDLSCLIAPRPLSVVTGVLDNIFPIDGVKVSFETVQKIYEAAGAKKNCSLVVTPKDHHWCPDLNWAEILRVKQQLGW